MPRQKLDEETRKARAREANRRWREANKEHRANYRKLWRLANPEKVRQYSRDKRIRAETDIDVFVDIIYRGIVDRSRARNHEMNVDRDYLKMMIGRSKMQCALSKLPLTFKKDHPYVVSVDRKNSNKGYMKGNIQIVASCVNTAKNALTKKQFVTMCKAVAENNK